MAELYKYVCPSCGANLYPDEGEAVVACSFCGGVFDRSAIIDQHKRSQALRLADQIKEYKQALHAQQAAQAKVLRLTDEVSQLSQRTDTALPIWTHTLIPFHFAAIAVFLLIIYSAYKSDNKTLLVLAAALYAVLAICLISAGIKKRKMISSVRSSNDQLRSKLLELSSARDELTASEQSFDIDFIPAQYRSDTTLDRIIQLFTTLQAASLGEAFRLYDHKQHRNEMQQLKKLQIEIQKRQLRKLEELSDYDFDDTYDDDDFELAETAHAVRSTIALTDETDEYDDADDF